MCADLSFGLREAAVDADCLPALCPSCSFIPLGWPPLEALGRPARQNLSCTSSPTSYLGPGQQTQPEGFLSTHSSDWVTAMLRLWETV